VAFTDTRLAPDVEPLPRSYLLATFYYLPAQVMAKSGNFLLSTPFRRICGAKLWNQFQIHNNLA